MESPQFSKTVVSKYEGDNVEVEFHKIEFDDKVIINIKIDGAMDSTFDVPMSNKALMAAGDSRVELDLGIEPVVLVGDSGNTKLQIVATQVGKVVATSGRPKNTILSVGSRWFGKGDESSEDDFTKLLFVLENVKKLYSI